MALKKVDPNNYGGAWFYRTYFPSRLPDPIDLENLPFRLMTPWAVNSFMLGNFDGLWGGPLNYEQLVDDTDIVFIEPKATHKALPSDLERVRMTLRIMVEREPSESLRARAATLLTLPDNDWDTVETANAFLALCTDVANAHKDDQPRPETPDSGGAEQTA